MSFRTISCVLYLSLKTSEQIFNSFIKENVGEQAGHITKAHEDIRVNDKILHGLRKRKIRVSADFIHTLTS